MSTKGAGNGPLRKERVRTRYGVSWRTPDGLCRQLPCHDEASAMREVSDQLNTGATDVQVWRITTTEVTERVW